MSDSVNSAPLENDVDALYEQAYQPEESIPAEASTEEENVPRETIEEDKEPEYEITWKGENKKVPLSKLKSYAQQAYDYNEKMREYNINKELFNKEREEFEGKLKDYEIYKNIDDYTKQNQDWWNYVQESWNKLQGQENTGVNNSDMLTQKVEELSSKLKEREERERIEAQVKQDEALSKEIEGYKEKYPYFNWNNTDDEGENLERKILKHAIDNNISKFSAAANDYLHDEFLKRSKFEGKEDYTNKVRVHNKMGIKDVEKTKKPKSSYDKSKSYDDLAKEALDELGLVD